MSKTTLDYKKAGVDIEKGDAFVERIKKLVPTTFNENVIDGIGGFAALYQLSPDRLLASCTDGVGTKLKLAQTMDSHKGVGIDLVAMCVNDLLCVGAKPLFFLDYMAFGKLNTRISEELIQGMVDGCKQSGMALIGGETAEMPGFYQNDEYDVAGFSVGDLTPAEMFSEKNIEKGDVLIGLASSGFHSNGYSLVRKLVKDDETELMTELLAPTRIYVSLIQALRTKFPQALRACAHITGGGIHNIPRISENFDFQIDYWPSLKEVAPVIGKILSRVEASKEELFKTFNMGVGFVLLVKQAEAKSVLSFLKERDEKAWVLGSVKPGTGEVTGDY
jgi:phosphoribosylformylglycinamidine cyclo-ligase